MRQAYAKRLVVFREYSFNDEIFVQCCGERFCPCKYRSEASPGVVEKIEIFGKVLTPVLNVDNVARVKAIFTWIRTMVGHGQRCEWYRNIQNGYVRTFSIHKYDNMKNTATPFVIPARNLYSQIFTFGKKNEKFHTMMRKSSMLKLCQQPAMNLSTSYKHFKNTHGAKQEDNENKSDNVVRKSKEEICRNICADLEETSKRRHSYKELHASGKMSESNDMDKKLKKSSTTIQSAENLKTLKDTKTTAEQLEAPSTDLESPKQSEDSSTAIHSPEKVKGSSMTVVVQSSEVKIPSNTTPTDSPFIEKQSTKTEVLKNTSTNIHLPEKLESSSIAMKSTKKTDSSSNLIREKRSEEEKDERRELEETERTKNSGMPLNERLTSVQNMKMRKSQSDGPDFHGQPKMRIFGHQELPRRMQYRAPQNVRVTLSPPNPPQQMNRTDPSPSQYTRPNFRDVPNQKSPLSSYRQPHKVPFAYRPEDIRYAEKLKSAQLRPRDKNPHPSLMLENRYVRYIEVPYKPPNESMRRMTQRLRKQRLSYESQNIKEINGKAMGNILADVRDATTINTNDVMQESRSTMSKLVENHSVVIEGPSKLKLVTLPQPQLRHETDVIIKMEYVTLTDADRRHFLSGKYNPYSYSTMSVGRTGCGKVIETGPKVSNVKLGDKVLVKQVSCEKCELCLSDRRNVCEHVTVSDMSPMQGTLSRLHVHPSEFITKIPQNVSLLKGTMASTLAIAIRACQKAAVAAGDVIMVIGGGPIGTATALAAQQMGATTVCLADSRQPVLEEAKKLGVEKTFLIDLKSPSRNTAIKIWEDIGYYPRLTFDCTGWQLTNEIAFHATKTGGKVIIMTNNENGGPFLLSNVVARDIDLIVATTETDESTTAALRFLSTNKVFFSDSMYTHYDMSNVEAAFKHLNGPEWLDSQVIIKCGCTCGSKKNANKGKAKLEK